MVTNENNSHINSFTGGIDSDTAYQMLESSKYTLAENLRVYSLNATNSSATSNAQGEIRPIEGIALVGYKYYYLEKENDEWIKKEDAAGIANVNKVLAYGSIRNYGVFIIEHLDNSWSVYRFENKIGKTSFKSDTPKSEDVVITRVFGPCASRLGGEGGVDKVSINLTLEDVDDNVKLYIADGEHNIIVINIHPDQDEYNANLNGDITKVESYPKITFDKPIINSTLEGSLKPAVVQYSYSLYNKNGIHTDVSPLTKQIPIVKNTNNNWINSQYISGLDDEEESTIGISLSFILSPELNHFTHILVYRITYVQAGQAPTIELIIDKKIDDNTNTDGSTTIIINDVGQTALSTLTLEEFNSFSGIHIVPKVIESKDGYLFAANIVDRGSDVYDELKNWDARAYSFGTDGKSRLFKIGDTQVDRVLDGSSWNVPEDHDCINKYNSINIMLPENPNGTYKQEDGYFDRFVNVDGNWFYGGEGKNIRWRFLIKELVGDNTHSTKNYGTASNRIEYIESGDGQYNKFNSHHFVTSTGEKISRYVDSVNKSFNEERGSNTYSDITNSAFYKSLRRDEIYRYGIIFYDNKGQTSEVKWIADIRTPNMYYTGFNTFLSNTSIDNVGQRELAVYPLGILFEIKNLPNGVAAYEIVRCNRTDSDIATLSQGVVSRPIKRNTLTEVINVSIDGDTDSNSINPYEIYPYTPTGMLTTARWWAGKSFLYNLGKKDTNPQDEGNATEADNYANDSVFQFVSPEVSYLKDTFITETSHRNLYINSLMYLFGSGGSNKNDYVWPYTLESACLRPGISNINIHLPRYGGTYGNSGKEYFDDSAYPMRRFSIYNHTNFLASTYYAATIADATTDGFSYMTTTGNTVKVDKKNTWPYVKRFAYGYIKLYEQSRNVHISEDLKSSYTAPAQATTKIKDVQLSMNGGWDDFFETTSSDDGKTSVTDKYKNYFTSVGENGFCNMIVGGLYDYPSKLILGDTNNVWDLFNRSTTGEQILGAGGACAVLNLDLSWNNDANVSTSNLFSTTLAAVRDIKNESVSDESFKDLLPTKDRWDRINDASDYIYRDSIAGTYLCNIRKAVTPYGGSDYKSRTLNTYYSYGDYHTTDDQNAVVFDGDCFIHPFEYTSMHKVYFGETKTTLPSTMISYAIPVETNINLAYTSGFEFSKNYNVIGISNIQIEPSRVYDSFTQDKPEYVYNSAYSANSTVRMFAAGADEQELNKHLDYRCYHSNLKINDERIDSWTKFQPSNYIDVDTRYGAITNLRTFHNQLVYWQENAVGLFSVNERTTITDDSNMPLILGYGGILARYDYVDTSGGMHKEEFCDAQSSSALYWFDDDNQEIKALNGQNIISLTKTTRVQNIMHQMSDVNATPRMFYDKRYGEIISEVLEDSKSIVYTEPASVFTSIYTIPFVSAISFSNGTYIANLDANRLQLAQWNKLENEDRHPTEWRSRILPTYLQYVVNAAPLITKVFDNQELVTANIPGTRGIDDAVWNNLAPEEVDEFNEIDTSTGKLYTPYFSNNHIYKWATDLNSTTSQLHGDITRREGNYRYAIPRVDGALFGNRIRGKYMICSIKCNKPKYDASLSYILTKFRQSWI